MPEDLLHKVKMSIPAPWKSCFLSALILGFIAHFYKITNWLPNWDSLVFRYDPQNMIALGRWFLPVVCAPSSFYDLPWITGLLSILLHGLGAVCICAMFGIRKNTTAAMIGAAVITFPTVTSVLRLLFTKRFRQEYFGILTPFLPSSLTQQAACRRGLTTYR